MNVHRVQLDHDRLDRYEVPEVSPLHFDRRRDHDHLGCPVHRGDSVHPSSVLCLVLSLVRNGQPDPEKHLDPPHGLYQSLVLQVLHRNRIMAMFFLLAIVHSMLPLAQLVLLGWRIVRKMEQTFLNKANFVHHSTCEHHPHPCPFVCPSLRNTCFSEQVVDRHSESRQLPCRRYPISRHPPSLDYPLLDYTLLDHTPLRQSPPPCRPLPLHRRYSPGLVAIETPIEGM